MSSYDWENCRDSWPELIEFPFPLMWLIFVFTFFQNVKYAAHLNPTHLSRWWDVKLWTEMNKGLLCVQCAFACFFTSEGAENPKGFAVVFVFIKQPQEQHYIIILSRGDCKLSACQGNCCCKWWKLFAELTSLSVFGDCQWADNRLTANNYSHCFLSAGYTVLRLISNPDISDLLFYGEQRTTMLFFYSGSIHSFLCL